MAWQPQRQVKKGICLIKINSKLGASLAQVYLDQITAYRQSPGRSGYRIVMFFEGLIKGLRFDMNFPSPQFVFITKIVLYALFLSI